MTARSTLVPAPAIPQVKSLTFVTLRNELQTRFVQEVGQQASRRLWDAFLPATRTTLESAEPGEWIDEVIMLDVMRCLLEVGFEGDDVRYSSFLRAVGAAGVSRFLKIFLSLTSASFVLRRIPTVWSHLRRNAGIVTTTRHAGGVRLLYTGFPVLRLSRLPLAERRELSGTGRSWDGDRPACLD